MENVILLNQDYTFLRIINWKRALNLIVKEKVEVLKYTDKVLSNAEKTYNFQMPKVLKLVYHIKSFYHAKVKYSKKNVLVRDNYECAYCGCRQKRLTIDHVIPKSKGGKSTFENTVASCKTCNNSKQNRTPREAGMKLKKKMYAPTIYSLMRHKIKDIESLINWEL